MFRSLVPQRRRADSSDLGQLWEKAEEFGLVSVASYSLPQVRGKPRRRYRVSIDFQTIPGISLSAQTDFQPDLYEAFDEVIAKAQQIMDSQTP